MAPWSKAASCFFFSPSPSLLLLCSFSVLHHVPFSFAIDAISANNSLRGNQSTISVGGNFRLGFFTPTGSSSLNFYIGIWYDKISVFTPVWVANRGTPVEDPTSSELRISDDGNLVLLLLSNSSIIWSTNVAVPSDSTTVAVILDTGNLQLRDESNSSLVFWQSFDYPTDTWLPGAKLRFDKLTNRSQPLTAWKSKVDPAPGIFTLEVDLAGTYQCYMLWNSSRIYWASGLWNGNTFGSIPEIAPSRNFGYGYLFVDNEKEFYFAYTIDIPNMISRNVLDPVSGLSQQWTWIESSKSWVLYWTQPRFRCSVFALCGPFGICNDFTSSAACNCIKGFRIKSPNDWDLGDKTAGCERITPLQCEQKNTIDSQKDGFLMMTNVRLPDKADTSAMAGTSEECELACLNDCSCNAYSYNTTGCFVWHGSLLNLQQQYNRSDAGTLHLRLAAMELQTSGSNKNRVETWVVVVGVVSTIVLICLAIAIWIMISKRRSRKMIQSLNKAQSSLVSFTYSELQHATRNFSEKLGGGGFGSVFKGSLPGSVAIAVKKLEGLRQGEKPFRTEVSTIGRIQHINLVRLLGFCSRRSEKLLVYEFMPNGSLNSHISDRTDSTVLNWRTRYQIAIGIAKGLDYLHEQCRDCIIHCDIKPENILLDASFNPKVADFGLAKLMGRDFSRVVTTLRGTPGYLAPEWITGVAITTKADVYSYGMMLLEIISGRRNVKQTEQGSCLRYHPTSMASKLISGEVASVLDGGVGNEEVDVEELERACKIAFWCIQNEESCRPTMGQVVQVLEGVVDVDMPPIPRSLQLADESVSETISFFH